MDESGGNSEVARAIRQIDLELEATNPALHGFAITARHDFINARMQRGGERILRLIDEGKQEEALALMNSDDWGGERGQQTTERQHQTYKQRKDRKKGK